MCAQNILDEQECKYWTTIWKSWLLDFERNHVTNISYIDLSKRSWAKLTPHRSAAASSECGSSSAKTAAKFTFFFLKKWIKLVYTKNATTFCTHGAGRTGSLGWSWNQVILIRKSHLLWREIMSIVTENNFPISAFFQPPSRCPWWTCCHRGSTPHHAALTHCPEPKDDGWHLSTKKVEDRKRVEKSFRGEKPKIFEPCCWRQLGQSSLLPGFSWTRARQSLPTRSPFGWEG